MADFLPTSSMLKVCLPVCLLNSGEVEQLRKSKEIDQSAAQRLNEPLPSAEDEDEARHSGGDSSAVGETDAALHASRRVGSLGRARQTASAETRRSQTNDTRMDTDVRRGSRDDGAPEMWRE